MPDQADGTVRRRVLAAPDKFKGTATAAEVAAAIAAGAANAGFDCVQCPLADGGEGTLEALGGANRASLVTGPAGSEVSADWRCSDGVAVIEMARASGLSLVGGPEQNDPVTATTRGTGELIRDAIHADAKKIIVAVGGSATTDGGAGALEALRGLIPFPAQIEVIVAVDVTTHFVDAATVFGPQKGASAAQVSLLTQRLEGLATRYLDTYGRDVSGAPGAGAAGGLAGGLMAAGASIASGFELVARAVGFSQKLRGADVVVTGEGHLDDSSFSGKVTGRVLNDATRHGVPVLMVVGGASVAHPPRGVHIATLETLYRDAAWDNTLGCIADSVEQYLTRDSSFRFEQLQTRQAL